jgi:predicted secreted hydrolase
MLVNIRDEQGQIITGGGSFIQPDGKVTCLAQDKFSFSAKGESASGGKNTDERWISPKTSRKYPLDWQIESKELDCLLKIKPFLKECEIGLFWEGPVEARGKFKGDEIKATGYLELVGYGVK